MPLLGAISAAAVTQFGSQELANTAWAFARLNVRDAPLLDAISQQSLRLIALAKPQHLSNMVWSLAVLYYTHKPLLTALSAESISKLPNFAAQELANTAWAFAHLHYPD